MESEDEDDDCENVAWDEDNEVAVLIPEKHVEMVAS